MAKGFTYFATSKDGVTHKRYSVGHPQARYTFAAILSARTVSYSSTKAGAEAMARQGGGWGFSGCYVVPVRAYPGRLAVEPTV